MPTTRASLFACIVLVAASITHAVDTTPAVDKTHGVESKSDWTQYRGTAGQGIGTGTDWTHDAKEVGLEVDWKRAIGSGYSSVSIGAGRLIAFFHEGDSEILASFDIADGKEQWRYVAGEGYAGHDGSHDGPLSTPAIAGKQVLAFHPGGRLFAVATATGEPIWELDVKEEYGANAPFYGFAGSPLIVGASAILQVGGEEGFLVAFDTATGEERWKVGGDRVQYQTSSLMRHAGRETILAAGIQSLYGIDPATGAVLWTFAYEGAGSAFGAGGATPVPAGENHVFVTHKDDLSIMIRLDEQDGKTVPVMAWESRHIRHSYGAPVYKDGYLYGFSSRFLVCIDAKTGEPRWRSRAPGDGFVTLVDDHLVIFTKDGTVHLAEATPEEYREVAGITVFKDNAWSPPSFAGGDIYVRSLGEIARVGLTGKKTTVLADSSSNDDLAGTRFGTFLAKIEAADSAEAKQALVDEFFATVSQTPVVEPGWVHFVYRGKANDVAVAGDLTEIEREDPMRRVSGTDLFYASHPLESDARLTYALLVDYEQQLDPRNPRKTDIAVMGEDLTLSTNPDTIEMSWFSMPDWKRPEFLEPADSARAGKLETHEVTSKIAPSATAIQVYLPAGYDPDSERRYPVVYVHGGPLALGLGAWQTALDNLLGKTIEPLIAVFLGPITAFGPQATAVVAEEIVPFIDQRYATRAEAGSRANVGGGFEGTNAFFCTFGRADLFGGLATQGAFLTEYAWNPLQQLIPAAEGKPMRIYLDWGKYDMRNSHENWNLRTANQRVVELLEKHGFDPDGGEVHDGTGWPSWRNRTDAVLSALFPMSADPANPR